jgi:hypothetical protein
MCSSVPAKAFNASISMIEQPNLDEMDVLGEFGGQELLTGERQSGR